MSIEKAQKKLFKETFRRPKGDSWAVYRRLLRYGKPFWLPFCIAVLANICYSGIDSLFAYLLKPLLDNGFVSPDATFIKQVPLIAVGLFFCRLLASLAGNYFMAYVGRHVVMTFRREIFAKLMRLPCSFYDNSASGQLLAMIVYNAAQVTSACTDAITTLIQSSCLVIGLITVMLVISWRLTLMFFILIPLIAFLIKMTSKRLRRLNHKAQETMGSITHTAEEAIEGYKVVRMFGGEALEIDKFKNATRNNLRRELKIVVTKTLSVSSVQFLGVCGLAFIIFIGTSAAMQETLTAGGFTAVLAAMMALLKPMKELTSVNATIQRGLAGAESIFALIDSDAERDEGNVSIGRAHGDLCFSKVGFHYASSKAPALFDVSFNVKAGEVVALVGRSGSGKSTLVSLLPRFYDYTQGEITLDGHRLFDIRLADLRRQISLVSQQVTLFNDTIFNNIAYGCLDDKVSEHAVLEAARLAHAMEFIEQLPEGIHSRIGENGVLLSGGQRQRIAIARALLKDAPILILDEATSALDTESERHIQAALEVVMQKRTTLVIAHRLSTIENADKIIVLSNGEVVEAGTHESLLAQEGHYAHLYSMQFKSPQQVSETVEVLG